MHVVCNLERNFSLSCVMAMLLCLWGNHFWPNWRLHYFTIIVYLFFGFVCLFVCFLVCLFVCIFLF